MDRELLVFYKKHGIPLDDCDSFPGTQVMPPANIHRSLPMPSCMQMIASETKRLHSIRLQSNKQAEQLQTSQHMIDRMKAELQHIREESLKAAESHQQERSDLLTQIMLLFAEINRLRCLSEQLSDRLRESEKTLRVIRADYNRELEKCKAKMVVQCEEQFTQTNIACRLYKRNVADQIDRMQSQYRAKMQQLTKFQASRTNQQLEQDEELALLKKQNAVLKLRNGQTEKRIKTLTSDLKITEADRRSEVANLNQEISTMASKITELEGKLQISEQRLSRALEMAKDSSADPSSSDRELSKSLTKVLAELKRLENDNTLLRSRLSDMESSNPSPRLYLQQIEQLREQLSKKSSELTYKQQEADLLTRQNSEIKERHRREMEEKDQRICELIGEQPDRPDDAPDDEADYH